MTRRPIATALLSVYEKRRVVEFARGLSNAGVALVSSGGTASALAEAGIPVDLVADVTGAPEILDGRVKTLHPAIHAGILADRSRPRHMATLQEMAYRPIDLVVSNLYPFEQTASQPDSDPSAVIDQIDIGGPALIRAAAKNHRSVAVVVSPNQYDEVAAAIAKGGLTDDHRRRLAVEAFRLTADYDAAISHWLSDGRHLPHSIPLWLQRHSLLRYGENPHQEAAAYIVAGRSPWWAAASQLQGKEMSFNNFRDADAAWRLVLDHDEPTAAVIKHMNPAGVASRPELNDAFNAAWKCDPTSAFGSAVAINRDLDQGTAAAMVEHFIEVIIAPSVSAEAVEQLADRPQLRLLVASKPGKHGLEYHDVDGGFLAQVRDQVVVDTGLWKVVSRASPTDREWADLEFAWKVCAHVKSNAIVIAKDLAAVGVGAGDQSRIGAARRALTQAGDRSKDAVAASDAFLPFPDALDALASSGVTAVVEPGGSRRDDQVIAAADEHGISVVFTGRRHFRH